MCGWVGVGVSRSSTTTPTVRSVAVGIDIHDDQRVSIIIYTFRFTHPHTPPQKNNNTGQTARQAFLFLESALRHKSEVVIYEAARAMCCALPGLEARDLGGCIN